MIPIIIIILGCGLLIGCGFLFYKTFIKRPSLPSQSPNVDLVHLKPGVKVTRENCMEIAKEHALWIDGHGLQYKSEESLITGVTYGRKRK